MTINETISLIMLVLASSNFTVGLIALIIQIIKMDKK